MKRIQDEAVDWTTQTFGNGITNDKRERALRFLEEALELVQACDVPLHKVGTMVEYVYGRKQGEVKQEVGGVLICLFTLCGAHGIDSEQAVIDELSRAWNNQAVIRSKHFDKPSSVK